MEHILSQLKGGNCYCSHPINREDWNSEWGECDEQHYKKAVCSKCGKTNWIKLRFEGSGHDDSIECKTNSIDSIIRKVQGY
ncbi:hypothetical protein COV17_02615 [Candidatus Woesearchaeota archaeon CG10_big_fil_rev_8_21_14_0_10_36_11]|nr:MAG: hypothetical protein COV17_02615 [Candidatus Woesearchaeota archaeon CG10_big_fil_rev_8_21_14_0_10_36_11]